MAAPGWFTKLQAGNMPDFLPVGFLYVAAANVNPASLLGFGTWSYKGTMTMKLANAINLDVYVWERTA